MMPELALALLCLLATALSRHVPSREEIASIISRKSPQGVPADFECAWRSLALSYAAQLQPQRPARVLADVFDALQLGPLCNQSFKFPALLDIAGTLRDVTDLSDLWCPLLIPSLDPSH